LHLYSAKKLKLDSNNNFNKVILVFFWCEKEFFGQKQGEEINQP
jgi:hypothetical protein